MENDIINEPTDVNSLPKWQHLLESIKCDDDCSDRSTRSTCGLATRSELKRNRDLLKNLKIPSEEFELLLKVVERMGYNSDNIELIVKNLPKNYDLSKLSRDLIKKILELRNGNNVSPSDGYRLKRVSDEMLLYPPVLDPTNTLNGAL